MIRVTCQYSVAKLSLAKHHLPTQVRLAHQLRTKQTTPTVLLCIPAATSTFAIMADICKTLPSHCKIIASEYCLYAFIAYHALALSQKYWLKGPIVL